MRLESRRSMAQSVWVLWVDEGLEEKHFVGRVPCGVIMPYKRDAVEMVRQCYKIITKKPLPGGRGGWREEIGEIGRRERTMCKRAKGRWGTVSD